MNESAKHWVVGMDQSVVVGQVGRKFANLQLISSVLSVPSAVCVTVAAYEDALGHTQMTQLRDFFVDIEATSGAFLTGAALETRNILADLYISSDLRATIQAELTRSFGSLDDCIFAVRSSAVNEDTNYSSYAGMYRTTLQVQGLDQVFAAVLDCWHSYYDYPAVLARVRAGVFSYEPGMAVIIQKMVPAQLAGVAFTTGSSGHDVLVEYVHGLGENLVSGTVTPQRYHSDDRISHTDGEQFALSKVVAAAVLLREHFDYDLDIEWAWVPNAVEILQVRPVTASLSSVTAESHRGPHFSVARLYLDETLPPNLELGECLDIYVSYVAKRGLAYQCAAVAGIMTGAAHVISLNGSGLSSDGDPLECVLGTHLTDTVILDISPSLRQIIIKKQDLRAYITSVFGFTPESEHRHSFIIRDYLQGQYGFISLPFGEDDLLVEYSAEGLLAINRGLAECTQIIWPDHGTPPNIGRTDEHAVIDWRGWNMIMPRIYEFTHALNKVIPGCQLEWVLHEETPFFIDYSTEAVGQIPIQYDGSLIISPGTVSGPALLLGDDAGLSRLSIGPAVSVTKVNAVEAQEPFRVLLERVVGMSSKPVVFARQPYAALAVLLDHVAGFVFERGSLLCHLAILLREAAIPAVVAPHVKVRQNDRILIDQQNVICLTPAITTPPGDSYDRLHDTYGMSN